MTGRRARRASRFGASTTTHSFPVRVLLTLPFVLLIAGFVAYCRQSEDPLARFPGMMGIVVVGYSAFIVLPYVWRTSDAFVADRLRVDQVERRLHGALHEHERPRHSTLAHPDVESLASEGEAAFEPSPVVQEPSEQPRQPLGPDRGGHGSRQAQASSRYGRSVTGLPAPARLALTAALLFLPVTLLLILLTSSGVGRVFALAGAVLFGGPAYFLLPGIWTVNDSWTRSQWQGRKLERQLHRELHGQEPSAHSRLSNPHHGTTGLPRRW
jgi:hypothetical protein